MKFCTVIYDGTKQPKHLREMYRIKNFVLPHGKSTEIPDHIAGMAKRSLGDSLKITKGTPNMTVPVAASIKATARKNAEFREQFPVDPALELSMAPQLSEKAVKLVMGELEPLNKAIEAGELDGDGVAAAIALWVLRRDEPAKEMARRIKE